MKKIILASTSSRRKELLAKTGLVFETASSNYEEDMTLALPPKELAMHLSKGKAEAVSKTQQHAIIIAADTFIAYQDTVLGKPHTPEKAEETLKMLSGKTHSVITGFTIIDSENNRSVSQAVETKVHFKDLTELEIQAYIATGEPLDKAGAYAIQGLGSELVDRIEGDYSNVVGLPVDALLKALEGFGVSVSKNMKLLLTINENDLEPQDYIIRKVVRSVILDESGTKVLFFGSHLVGGGVEEGETDEQAVAREAMEEAGARVEILTPLGEVVAYRDFLKRKYVSHGYLCKQLGEFETPTTTDPEEQGTKVAWVEIHEAIEKLEREIAALPNNSPLSPEDDVRQRRSHNRRTSLAFLREVLNHL